MTQDEVIEMARQVWLSDYGSKVMLGGEDVEINLEDLEAFAKLVAAKEREACAKVCDGVYYQNIGPEFGEVRYGIAACSAAIRARGEA